MCDYSLFEHPNRLAVEEEELVAYRFPSHSMGLVSPTEFSRSEAVCTGGILSALKRAFVPRPAPVAVCVPHGAQLRLEQIDSFFRKQNGLQENEEVTFVQTTVASHTHRDAIRFASGQQILLQNIPERQRMRVLTLGSEAVEALGEPHVEERQAA